jgi:predicted anti-sigma-YlaC factor YlaD
MKSSSEKQDKDQHPNYGLDALCGKKLLKCEDIQPVLFAYMSRELGETQSVLVREHIRKCAACRSEAAEIQETLDLLNDSAGACEDSRLSDERRERILLAVFHPVINWIDLHHRLVSILLALLVLASVLLGLRHFEIFRPLDLGEHIQVKIVPENIILHEKGQIPAGDKTNE